MRRKNSVGASVTINGNSTNQQQLLDPLMERSTLPGEYNIEEVCGRNLRVFFLWEGGQ